VAMCPIDLNGTVWPVTLVLLSRSGLLVANWARKEQGGQIIMFTLSLAIQQQRVPSDYELIVFFRHFYESHTDTITRFSE
jgi:hypothetical protein